MMCGDLILYVIEFGEDETMGVFIYLVFCWDVRG